MMAPADAAAMTPTMFNWCVAPASAAAAISVVSPGSGMPTLSRPTAPATAQ